MLTLRDVEGLEADEVCDLLDLTPGNQRVILHRARARVRADARGLLRGGARVSFDEIVCREFVELATDYLDGAMPEPTLELVEEHLAMCDWCRDYLHHIEATAGAVAATADDARFAPAPPDSRCTRSSARSAGGRGGAGGAPR